MQNDLQLTFNKEDQRDDTEINTTWRSSTVRIAETAALTIMMAALVASEAVHAQNYGKLPSPVDWCAWGQRDAHTCCDWSMRDQFHYTVPFEGQQQPACLVSKFLKDQERQRQAAAKARQCRLAKKEHRIAKRRYMKDGKLIRAERRVLARKRSAIRKYCR